MPIIEYRVWLSNGDVVIVYTREQVKKYYEEDKSIEVYANGLYTNRKLTKGELGLL